MPSLFRVFVSLAVLAPIAGCSLYFGDDPPEPPCPDGAVYRGAPAPLRNPFDGTCQIIGGGGDGQGCYPIDEPVSPLPDWATCYTPCNGLDEGACLTAPGCRAAYLDLEVPDGGWSGRFLGCWGVAPSGPIQGSCAGLDAQACSEHDDCTAHYQDTGLAQALQFTSCQDEQPPASCDLVACPVGSHCEETCGTPPAPEPCAGSGAPGGTADGGGPTDGGAGGPVACAVACVPDAITTCDQVRCEAGTHCEELCKPCEVGVDGCMDTCTAACVPDGGGLCAATLCAPGSICVEECTSPPPGTGAPASCQAVCVAVTPPGPGACTGAIACDALPPACPVGSVAGIADGCWTGFCIPVAACGPSDPGACTGAVSCPAAPPACPAGTVPGISSGCWSGFCIPKDACPVASCDLLGSEGECGARPDCTPVYLGNDCTCTPWGCTCAGQTYDHCEAQVVSFAARR